MCLVPGTSHAHRAAQGMKMSKSLGNVVDPRSIVDGGADKKAQPALGADVLRLWVASVDYSGVRRLHSCWPATCLLPPVRPDALSMGCGAGDVLMGPNILSQVADVYRKLRFTLRFLLGNLADFDPAAHALPYADLPAVDRFTLAQFGALLDDATAAYDGYQFARVYQVPCWAALLALHVAFHRHFQVTLGKQRGAVLAAACFYQNPWGPLMATPRAASYKRPGWCGRPCSALWWQTCQTGTWMWPRTACMCGLPSLPTAAPARP